MPAQAADVAGCPVGQCAPTASQDTGVVTGWLRATNYTNEWPRWINLRDSGYGVTITNTGLVGWGWGSEVVGWVLFAAGEPCAETAGPFCSGNASMYKDVQCKVVTVIPDCGIGGCNPATGLCVSPPPPTTNFPDGKAIDAVPLIVQYGASSTVSWDVRNATQCTVTGNGDTWTGVKGSKLTSPINQPSVYVVSCKGSGGVLNGSVKIVNPPKFREI